MACRVALEERVSVSHEGLQAALGRSGVVLVRGPKWCGKSCEVSIESLCVRDLRVFMRKIGGGVYHYRDKNGLEVDVILRLDNGAWAGVEVKLGGQKNIDHGASNLIKLAEKVDAKKLERRNS